MLFSDNAVFDHVLLDLADQMAARSSPPIDPLPCDRWIARSCLQKAIRRAEPELAQRALANLFQHDRRATWRHLTIIALEDVGVANVDVLARIVAAQRNREWRSNQGGDWSVMAELVRQMAVSAHCQTACDLLLHALNDPTLDGDRSAALEQGEQMLARTLWDTLGTIETRAIAAITLAGGLAEGQRHNDPCVVFDIFAETGRSSQVIATCRAAWKISRNPMALLLPILWEDWIAAGTTAVCDDPRPFVQLISQVPGYALDQFTRTGNSALRELVGLDRELSSLFAQVRIPRSYWTRAAGDLLFLAEGSPLSCRAIWPVGEGLRLPYRQLPTVVSMGTMIKQGLELIRSRGPQIALIRTKHFLRAQALRAP